MAESDFGRNLSVLRKSKGMTQKELGDRLGLSFQGIAQWENDYRKPKIETLQRIADALNVNVFYFTDAENENGDNQIVSAVKESLDTDIAIERIGESLYKLNQAGKTEAVKRVEELTEIKKYQR